VKIAGKKPEPEVIKSQTLYGSTVTMSQTGNTFRVVCSGEVSGIQTARTREAADKKFDFYLTGLERKKKTGKFSR
jgi:hypothetical protein